MSKPAQTDTTIHPPTSTIERIRRRWDKLRGAEHNTDFERAKLLHPVFLHYGKDTVALSSFIQVYLDEYGSSRIRMFVRFVQAYDVTEKWADKADAIFAWKALGGPSMVLLTRLNPARRRRVMRSIRETLRHTKRGVVSHAALRSRLQTILGDAYRSILVAPGCGNRNKNSEAVAALTARLELAEHDLKVLRRFLLSLLCGDKKLKQRITPEVEKILGVHLVN